jgi:hypothetical protein
MLHYIKYLFKLSVGFMVIIALDVMLKKVDPDSDGWWLYMTLVFYFGYCYLDYRLTAKQEDTSKEIKSLKEQIGLKEAAYSELANRYSHLRLKLKKQD